MRILPLISLASTATSAAALFIVYRLAFAHLGGAILGLWALLSGLLAFARLSDNGAATALLRQTALARAESPSPRYGPHLWAGLTLATGPTSLLGILISITIYVVMHNVPSASAELRSALPMAVWGSLLFAIANSLSGVIGGCVDGSGSMMARLCASIFSNILLALVSIYAVPRFGLLGFVSSQVGSTFAQAFIYLFILARHPHSLASTRREFTVAIAGCWKFISGSIFLGLMRAGFEPATKMLISYFGGLPAVAVFDLANRVTAQLRQMIAAALQPFSLLAVRRDRGVSTELQGRLERWTRLSLTFSFVTCFSQVLATPFISYLVIGHIDREITIYSIMLAASTFANTAGTAAFFASTSAGHLSRLLQIHFAMLLMNFALGAILGRWASADGVVLAWAITFALGGVAVLGYYFRDNNVTRRTQSAFYLAICAGVLLLGLEGAAVMTHGNFYESAMMALTAAWKRPG